MTITCFVAVGFSELIPLYCSICSYSYFIIEHIFSYYFIGANINIIILVLYYINIKKTKIIIFIILVIGVKKPARKQVKKQAKPRFPRAPALLHKERHVCSLSAGRKAVQRVSEVTCNKVRRS